MPKVLFHSVENLGAPFLTVDEYFFFVPQSGHLVVNNQVRKIIFFFEGRGHCEMSENNRRVAVARFAPGDIMATPFHCEQRYYPPVPQNGSSEAPVRVHALRLAFDSTVIPPLSPPGEGRRASGASAAAGGGGDPEADFADFAHHHLSEFRHLPGGQQGEVRDVLDELRREAELRLPGYRFRVHALCVSLVVLVARQLSSGGASVAAHFASGKTDVGDEAPLSQRAYRIGQAQRFIHSRLPNPITLTDVACDAQVSEEHLARVFKQATGQSVGEYIRQTRLEQAKGFLVSGDLTVTEVARKTGFGSVALFSRSFRKYVGVSPLAYRQRLLGGVR